MKILRHKTTHVVKFIGDLELQDNLLITPKFRIPDISPSEYEVVEVPDAPEDFKGNHYSWNGSWKRTALGQAIADADAASQAVQAAEDLKKVCEVAILAHIQSKVDEYNQANGLSLTDVYRCEQYARTTGYTHQAFCQAVWEWNVAVWEEVRSLLAQAIAGQIVITGPADAISRLPAFTFGG